MNSVGSEFADRIDRSAFTKQFFADLAAAQSRADGPPPLGPHLIMGDDTALKVQHISRNIEGGFIAPIEIHARLPVYFLSALGPKANLR